MVSRYLLFLFLFAAAASPAIAAKKSDVDFVALAAVLIRDGHYDRAQAALDSVDLEKDDVDKARFFTLRGLFGLKREALTAAKADFERAIAEGQQDKVIYVYLAQANYGLQDYPATVAAIDKAGEAAEKIPGLFAMRAQAHWRMGEKEAAWTALSEGQARFPAESVFLRQKFFYLVEMGLYQKASEMGQAYLAASKGTEKDYLAVGSAMRKSGRLEEARGFLEQARLRYPHSEYVAVELANVYLGLGMQNAGADLFVEAALHNGERLAEAAELYRRAKRPFRALAMNAGIVDQEKKLKQRLAILLESERFEMAAAMEDGLYRNGLLEDEEIRYALAYAFFKLGRFDRAEMHLKHLTTAALFRKATELRKAMESCKGRQWQCW